jgi:hypothetical protein
MDVYVVPVGPERYQLYCESPDDHDHVVPREEASEGAPRGFRRLVRRLQEWFSHALAAIEREYERETARIQSHRHHRDSMFRRLRARSIRWLAERVAEQRLLWRLRRQSRVRAMYPPSLDEPGALREIRRNLSREADSHARWLVVDGIGMLLSGLLVPLPGPNLAGFYFTFRVVGHLLSMRGAKQGLTKVEWRLQPSALLGALADLGGLSPDARLERIRAIERELGLTKLARFFERMVGRAA